MPYSAFAIIRNGTRLLSTRAKRRYSQRGAHAASVRQLSPLLAFTLAFVMFLTLAMRPALAQNQPFPEGTLVQAPDGNLYVFEGGRYHLIRPAGANPQEMTAAPIGDPVVTGVYIIPPAAPPQLCGENFAVQVCVLNVQRQFQGSFTPNQGLEFVVFRLRIENHRDEQIYVPSYINALRVQEPNGSTRDWGSGGNTPAIPELIDGVSLAPGGWIEGTSIIALPVNTPLARIKWVLNTSPFEAVEAPIP
jgi:hypothetical protein